MGNSRFKLSDMMPKAWFYKLKHMSRSRKHSSNQTNTLSQSSSAAKKTSTIAHKTYVYDPRHSHFSLSFSDDPPRRSSNKRRVSSGRKAIYRPSPDSITCSPHPPAAWSSSNCNCRLSSSTKDIIIEQQEEDDGFHAISTKPDHDQRLIRSSTSPTGIRLRPKKIQALARKSTSTRYGNSRDSKCLAVVKSSCDPQRDFRESMVEMIVENNIRAPKGFEDLLACYLSLNSDDNHHLIVSAFQQIWFQFHHMPNNST